MSNQTLYKFRSWSDPIHKRWLSERQVYFASPAQFNDPFDCAINYRYDLLSDTEKFDKYYTMIRLDQPMLSDAEVKKHAEKWLREGLMEKERHLEINRTIIKEMIDERVGVLSLTKTKIPILLWSHYSNNHQGFCIGYDWKILRADFIKKYNDYRKMVFVDIDVAYSEDYPIIIPKKEITPDEYVKIPLSTKAKFWNYEEERRILLLGGAKELTQIPPEAIVEVTMGCNMPDKDQKDLGEFVVRNFPNANLYLARTHDESFELIFNKIN
jgi:hypothetical protein